MVPDAARHTGTWWWWCLLSMLLYIPGSMLPGISAAGSKQPRVRLQSRRWEQLAPLSVRSLHWRPGASCCNKEMLSERSKGGGGGGGGGDGRVHCKKWIVISTELRYLNCMTPLIIPCLPVCSSKSMIKLFTVWYVGNPVGSLCAQ